jgi:hypothetical protein
MQMQVSDVNGMAEIIARVERSYLVCPAGRAGVSLAADSERVAQLVEQRTFNPLEQNANPVNTPQVAPTPAETLSPSLSLNPKNDPDLAAVLTAWPALGLAVRRGLAAMAAASVEGRKARK